MRRRSRVCALAVLLAVTTALGQRTDLMTARKNLASSDINIQYLRNQMLPALNATATAA